MYELDLVVFCIFTGYDQIGVYSYDMVSFAVGMDMFSILQPAYNNVPF